MAGRETATCVDQHAIEWLPLEAKAHCLVLVGSCDLLILETGSAPPKRQPPHERRQHAEEIITRSWGNKAQMMSPSHLHRMQC